MYNYFPFVLSTLSTRSRHSDPEKTDRQTGGFTTPEDHDPYHPSVLQGIVYSPGSALACLPRANCPSNSTQTSNLSYPCPPWHVGMWQEEGVDSSFFSFFLSLLSVCPPSLTFYVSCSCFVISSYPLGANLSWHSVFTVSLFTHIVYPFVLYTHTMSLN